MTLGNETVGYHSYFGLTFYVDITAKLHYAWEM